MELKKTKRVKWFLIFFIAPALIIYVGIMIFPLFNSVYLSLHSGATFFPEEFVGFKNYIELFSKYPYIDRLANAFLNTLKFFAVSTILVNLGGFVISILVTKKFKGAVFFRRLSFLPVIISVLIAGAIFTRVFSPKLGIIDPALKFVGLEFLIRPWLRSEQLTLYVIAFVGAWQSIGIPVLLYSAGIDGIDRDLLEAASLDGATELKKVRHIIIPLLMPVFRTAMILSFIGTFTGFEIVYAMAGSSGGINFSSDIVGTLFYRAAFANQAAGGWGIGMGATVATVTIVFLAAVTLIIMGLFNIKRRTS